jgi:hypothetical protein
MHDWYIRVFMPILLGLLAACLLGMGLWALVKRRPYLFSARWLLVFVLLSFAPNLLMPFTISQSGDKGLSLPHNVMLWIGPVMFVVLAIFLSLQMRGYVAMAVTEASLREGLLAALSELRLPHEETMSSLRLPSVSGELQVAVQGWMGTGQLKARTPQTKGVLIEIVREMNRYYRTRPVGVNLVCPVTYIVLGVLMLVMVGAMVAM